LEAGQECGTDYRDASQEYIGTGNANALRDKVQKLCEERGLKVKPGIIDLA
jgi:hypothetical protein